ncbi:MAG: hypothetical protein RLZZ94_1639 [Bacteroidota bacterium]
MTTDRNGIPNSAYYFSGANCGTRIDATVNTSSIQTGVTISVWLKRIGNGCISPRILEFWPGNNGPGLCQWGWAFGYPGAANSIGLGSTTSSSFSCYSGISNPTLTDWLQVIYTNDGVVGKFYYNGVLINSVASNGNPILANNLAIGRMNHPAYDAFNGNIDDMGIWNRALTQQEITALYNAQTCTGTGVISPDGPTTFCAGNSVNLTSDVVGGTYQWKKNGINISTNGTSRTYKATATGSYTCVATCNGTALTSNTIAVTAKTNAFASVTASGATSFCLGDSVTLNCTNLGSNYSVQWYRTNVSMENATNYSLVVKQPGTYKVVTKNLTTGCSRISGSAITTSVNCRIAGDVTSGTTSEENTNNEARLIDNELSQGVHIYPNPNNGSFSFTYEGEETGDGILQIINTMGQSIYSSAVSIQEGGYTQEINLGDNYTKGFYIVRLLINDGYHDSRVMVR